MGKVYKGFSLYYRTAMAMETLTMLYNSEKKKVVMKHTPEKRITGRRINKKA